MFALTSIYFICCYFYLVIALRQVANRPRGEQLAAGRPAGSVSQLLQPSQNRGQDLDQPITPPPQPRRPTQPSSFDEAILSDIFTPIPFRDFPQSVVPAVPQAPPPPPPPQFAAAAPLREAVRSSSPPASEGFSNFPSREAANNPARGRTRLAVRPVAAGVDSQQPARVPVRSSQATARQVVGSSNGRQGASAQRPAPPAAQQPREEFAGAPPTFSSFPASNSPSVVPAFLAAQAPSARPSLTFQDDNAAGGRAAPALQLAATPTTLPKSALEIVDFNQLLQEFQGSQQQHTARARFPGDQQQQQNQFPVQQQQQAVVPAFQQARFSTNNFPVRF